MQNTDNFENINNKSNDSYNSNKPYSFIFKIILIGDSNCGKTSMINRYIDKLFSENYICTIGVDFKMKNLIINSELIKLQIWDTAGMEKYKQITTSYYRGAQAALICFDLTNRTSFINLEKWVNEYTNHSNLIFKKVIYIIGMKCDLESERTVSQEEIDQFVMINNYKYYESSSKTGMNIDGVFLDLAKFLYSHYQNIKDDKVKSAVCTRRSTFNVEDKYLDILNKEKSKKCSC
jgi:small GTP-binding protein